MGAKKESTLLSLLRSEPKDELFKNILVPRQNESLNSYAGRILKNLNLGVNFNSEKQQTLKKSDIIISNHPCAFDILFVLVLLGDERKYVFMTQHKRARFLKKYLSEDAVYPVPLDTRQLSDFLISAKEFLKQGRKIILFPTAGSEIMNNSTKWKPVYEKILSSEEVSNRKVSFLYIDDRIGEYIQEHIGDIKNGREIFPEIHYIMPENKIVIPIKIAEPFILKSEINLEEIYNNLFRN